MDERDALAPDGMPHPDLKEPYGMGLPYIFWDALYRLSVREALRNLDAHIEKREGNFIVVPND
jgi:hypothetical protein